LGLKGFIERHAGERGLHVDLGDTRFVDHSVMEKLHDLEKEFADRQWEFKMVGLDGHEPFSRHPHAARSKKLRRPPVEVT